MPLFEKHNGSFVRMHPSVKVGGTWKNIDHAWEKVGGVWTKIYTRRQLKLTNINVIEQFTATLNVYRNGTLDVRNHANVAVHAPGDEWVSVGGNATVGDGYEYRMTLGVGSDAPYSNGLMGVWSPINQDLFWTAMLGVNFSGTLEIGVLGTNTALVTASVHLESLLDLPPF